MNRRFLRTELHCAVLLVACISMPATARAGRSDLPPPATSMWRPAEIITRLTDPDSASVARACGVIDWPWAYRGSIGQSRALKVFGRRSANRNWATRVTGLLMRCSAVESADAMPMIEVDCDTADRVPIFVVRINRASANTFIVMRFDLGAALLFDGELPLGMIRFSAGGDSLWAAIREVLVDDAGLKGPRPESRFEPPGVLASDARPPSISVEELPSAIQRVSPGYPEDARRDQLSGTVWIHALVGKDGQVHDAVVMSGPGPLRDEALAAIWQWRFIPALTDGKPVAVWVSIPVRFSLH